MHRKKYEDLDLLPSVIAEAVCGREYKGEEWGEMLRPTSVIPEIEARRSRMTRESVDEFCRIADNRCRRAYETQASWFEKIVKAKGNGGRDQLYVWLSHWLVAYLTNPEKLRRDDKVMGHREEINENSVGSQAR